MRQLRALLHRLTGLLRRDARERELQAEIASHFQLHIDDNIRAGMSPEDARRAAILKFGPVESIKEAVRDRASIPVLEILIQDVRYALRRMRRQPGFTALIALTLALGVGANAAMFGLVDVLMFRTPAHVPKPERIVSVSASNYVQYQELRERLQSVELAAYTRHALSYGQGADALPVRTECVTPSYFHVAGVQPSRGRAFTEADDVLGAMPTIILSHGFAGTRFDGAGEGLGSPVTVAGRTFEVIGIAPPGFTGLGLGTIDAWILLTSSPEACSFTASNLLRSAGGSWLTTVGRLREGVTLPEAAAELAAVEPGIESRPTRRSRDGSITFGSFSVTAMYESRRLSLSQDSRLALWLAGGASMLLLLACANVAGLLWTHTLDRRREIAVRLQLGAGRGRVFAQLLIEHLLIAATGAVGAVAICGWIGEGVSQYIPFIADSRLIGGRTLVLVAALALAADLISGIVPALQASKGGAERFLRTGHAVMAASSRLRTGLLSLQIGVALMLVAGAGLFVASVNRYRDDFAYDLERVAVASIDFRKSSLRTPQEIHTTFLALEQRVRQLPQVESAALSASPVLGSGGSLRVFGLRRSRSDTGGDMHSLNEVSLDYFATLGLSMAAGRGFIPADLHGPPVIVIPEALAAKLFPGEQAVGQTVMLGNIERVVVGVSRPFRATIRPGDQAQSQIFIPMSDTADVEAAPQVLLVRTRGNAAPAVQAIAAALQGTVPDLPYVSVRTLEELADVQARAWLLGATVFGLFGTLAVVLAGIGIYGALAFSIRQRTTEIGVRLALGAVRGDIARMVFRHAAAVVSIGVILGLAGAVAGSRYLRSLLFNAAGADGVLLATAALVVIVAALLGCAVPAFSASRVDPAVTLRTE
jgi:predicted permease